MTYWDLFVTLLRRAPTWPRPASRLLLFHNYWGHCAPGNTRSFKNGFIPLSWSPPQHRVISQTSTETQDWTWMVVFAPTRSVNHGTVQPCRDTTQAVLVGWLNWVSIFVPLHVATTENVQILNYGFSKLICFKNVTVLGCFQPFWC